MITYKHTCDQCGKSVEQEQKYPLPKGWVLVVFLVINENREVVAGDDETKKGICLECLPGVLARTAAIIAKKSHELGDKMRHSQIVVSPWDT